MYNDKGALESKEATDDYVYILSSSELKLLKNAGISIYANPTKEALAQDKTNFYRDYCLDLGVDKMIWWLRDSYDKSLFKNVCVSNGYTGDELTYNYSCHDGCGLAGSGGGGGAVAD